MPLTPRWRDYACGPASNDATSTPRRPAIPGTSAARNVDPGWRLVVDQARATITSEPVATTSAMGSTSHRDHGRSRVALTHRLDTPSGPLTVVFVVKPDWSFTVVRSTSRFPQGTWRRSFSSSLLLAAADCPWAMVLHSSFDPASWHFATSPPTTSRSLLRRGRHDSSSTGTLAPNADLYDQWRVAATVIGTVIQLLAAVVIPTWNGRGMTGQ